MAGEAPLHGLAEGEAGLVSFRSSSASTSDDSFRSSAAWSVDMDLDDDDAMYRLMQSEYEEIPSFRWIASPLRWWKTRRTRKSTRLSKRSDAAGAASRGEEPGTAADTETESGEETTNKLVHLYGHWVFTLEDLLSASAEVLGKGTYGTLYAATLENRIKVAVKRVARGGEGMSLDEFQAEAKVLGKIRHPNLLPLRAYYCSKDEKLLVFDYMPEGSLSALLHGHHPDSIVDWQTRMNIAMGIARGLHHLHTYKNMVHGNLTSRNILLDDHTNAKIVDYGLPCARITFTDPHVMKTNGAFGYRAPELSKFINKANTKFDVYGLGVVLLELLTGKSPTVAINGLDLPRWVASLVEEGRTHDAFDPQLMEEARTKGDEMLLNTLYLALKCVDTEPLVRPEVLQVLLQLKEMEEECAGATRDVTAGKGDKPTDEGAGQCVDTSSPHVRPEVLQVRRQTKEIKQEEVERATGAATARGGDKPTDDGIGTVGTPTTVVPTTGERTTSTFEDTGLATCETSNASANDGNLEAGMSENIASSPFVSPASGAEVMLTPINFGGNKVEELAESTSQCDVKEGIIQDHAGNGELQAINEGDVETTSGDQSPSTEVEAAALPEGNNTTPFSITNIDEVQKVEVAQPTEDAAPTRELEEVPKPLLIVKGAGEGVSTEGTDATSRSLAVSPLASINWAEVTLESHLEVPTSSPLISSEPDLVYQRYFQTLYDLAHRSPPLPSVVLQVQLNRMAMGLHSLGYPLDIWLKAATLVLVSAEKREHIERHVDGYKVHVEAQLAEVDSVIAPVKEEISRTKSHITTQEQKQGELDEDIAKLEDRLSAFKAQREEISNSLATARDQLAVAETKMASVSTEMGRLKQQYTRISDLRSAMLCELPSQDEVFDSSFRDIRTRKI